LTLGKANKTKKNVACGKKKRRWKLFIKKTFFKRNILNKKNPLYMEILKKELIDYASGISGYDNLVEEQKVKLSQINAEMEYIKQQPIIDYIAFEEARVEYDEVKTRLMFRIHEIGGYQNQYTLDRYNQIVNLIQTLNESNKEWVETQFKRIKRDYIKSKYSFKSK